MSEKNNGGPAFPSNNHPTTQAHEAVLGMTLRDWFAGQALAGLGTQQDENGMSAYGFSCDLAREAYQAADAMLAERDK